MRSAIARVALNRARALPGAVAAELEGKLPTTVSDKYSDMPQKDFDALVKANAEVAKVLDEVQKNAAAIEADFLAAAKAYNEAPVAAVDADEEGVPARVNQAMQSSTVLQCLAEIKNTEHKWSAAPSAEELHDTYQSQYDEFEGKTAAALAREGVDEATIEHLRHCYYLRAHTSIGGISRALGKITWDNRRVDYLDATKLTEGAAGLYNKKSADWATIVSRVNDPGVALVAVFRGVKGLFAALEKGLTAEQEKHLYDHVMKYSVSNERHNELLDMWINIASSSQGKEKFQELTADMDPFERDYLLQIMVDAEYVDYLPDTPNADAEKFIVEEALPRAFLAEKHNLAKTPAGEFSNNLVWALDMYNEDGAVGRQARIMQRLTTAEFTVDQKLDILEPFIDSSDPESLVLDLVTSHPLSAVLFENKFDLISRPMPEYTKDMEDGTESAYADVSARQAFQDVAETDAVDVPETLNYPYNAAIENVIEMKLLRLATKFLKYDLQNEFGMAQFDHLVHTYDISPGEDNLDRVHGLPPMHHTYEELPIIKFDGWEEADVPEDYPEYLEQLKAAEKSGEKSGEL